MALELSEQALGVSHSAKGAMALVVLMLVV